MNHLIPKAPTSDYERIFPEMELFEDLGRYMRWNMFEPTLDGQFGLGVLREIVAEMEAQQATHERLQNADGFVYRKSPQIRAELERLRIQ